VAKARKHRESRGITLSDIDDGKRTQIDRVAGTNPRPHSTIVTSATGDATIP